MANFDRTGGVYNDLLQYAFRVLARRAHTAFELEEKLKSRCTARGIPLGAALQTLERLRDLHYLDDRVFTEDYLRARTGGRMAKGRYGLQQQLRYRGISKELFDDVWHSLGIDEVELAMRVARERARRLRKTPPERIREKVAMRLASRGFSAETVAAVLDQFSRATPLF